MTSPMSPDQQTADQIIQAQLQQWGLSSLSAKVADLIRQGYGTDAITLQLEATNEYKQRFEANDARLKAGLAVLTPAQYVATENSYRQVLQSYGLPAGFYDSQSDFHNFIANDVSPDEVKNRAAAAQTVWLSHDEGTKAVWRDFYGLTDGAAIASILDPKTAMPVIQNMVTTAQAGAAARANGLQADQGRIQSYVDQGFNTQQLTKAFSQIGSAAPEDQAMAQRFGVDYTQADSEAANITGTASALRKQQQMYDSEQALFKARASGDANSLNSRQAGSF